MTILSKPVVSNSYKSWETIAGGNNNLLVQQRTEEGIRKNRRITHRIAYTTYDQFHFRVIYSEQDADLQLSGSSVDAGSSSRCREGEENRSDDNGHGYTDEVFNSTNLHGRSSWSRSASMHTLPSSGIRYSVALADTKAEILDDWDSIKSAWSLTGGNVDVRSWNEFYNLILGTMEEEQREIAEAGAKRLLSNKYSIIADMGTSQLTSSSIVSRTTKSDGVNDNILSNSVTGKMSEEVSGLQVRPPIPDSYLDFINQQIKKEIENKLQIQNRRDSGGCALGASMSSNYPNVINEIPSKEEQWVLRILSAWLWNDPYRSLTLLTVLSFCTVMQYTNIFTLMIILWFAGVPFPVCPRQSAMSQQTKDLPQDQQLGKDTDILLQCLRSLLKNGVIHIPHFLFTSSITLHRLDNSVYIRNALAVLVGINFLTQVVVDPYFSNNEVSVSPDVQAVLGYCTIPHSSHLCGTYTLLGMVEVLGAPILAISLLMSCIIVYSTHQWKRWILIVFVGEGRINYLSPSPSASCVSRGSADDADKPLSDAGIVSCNKEPINKGLIFDYSKVTAPSDDNDEKYDTLRAAPMGAGDQTPSILQPSSAYDVRTNIIIENCAFLLNQEGWQLEQKTKDGIHFYSKETELCDKKGTLFTMIVEGANAASFDRLLNDDPYITKDDGNAFFYDKLLTKAKRVRGGGIGDDGILLSGPDPYNINATIPSVVRAHTFYKSPVMFIVPRDMVTDCCMGLYLNEIEQKAMGVGMYARHYSAHQIGGSIHKIRDCVPNVFVHAATDRQEYAKPEKGSCRGAVYRHIFLVEDLIEPEADKLGTYCHFVEESGDGDASVGRVTAGSCRVTMGMVMDPQGSIPATVVNLTNSEQINKLRILRDMATNVYGVIHNTKEGMLKKIEIKSTKGVVREEGCCTVYGAMGSSRREVLLACCRDMKHQYI